MYKMIVFITNLIESNSTELESNYKKIESNYIFVESKDRKGMNLNKSTKFEA